MDRIINVRVDGFRVSKDCRTAGTKHEGNATIMKFVFDASWDGASIDAVFYNAKGEKATIVALYPAVDGEPTNDNVMECKIPFEAMTEVGEATYSLVGTWIGDGTVVKRQRTITDSFEVLPAEDSDDAENASEPTADEMDQIKEQMTTLNKNMNELMALNLTEVKGYADAAHADMVSADSHRASAQTSAVSARSARDAIYNMGVAANGLAPGAVASVAKEVASDGSVKLIFGIPKGDTGAKGPKGDRGENGTDPYVYAKESCGYTGTREEFDALYRILFIHNMELGFTLDGGIYYMQPGMTWNDFIASRYNTVGVAARSDGFVYGANGKKISGGFSPDGAKATEPILLCDWYESNG